MECFLFPLLQPHGCFGALSSSKQREMGGSKGVGLEPRVPGPGFLEAQGHWLQKLEWPGGDGGVDGTAFIVMTRGGVTKEQPPRGLAVGWRKHWVDWGCPSSPPPTLVGKAPRMAAFRPSAAPTPHGPSWLHFTLRRRDNEIN